MQPALGRGLGVARVAMEVQQPLPDPTPRPVVGQAFEAGTQSVGQFGEHRKVWGSQAAALVSEAVVVCHKKLQWTVTQDFSGRRHGNVSSALGAPPTSKRVGVGPDLRELWNVPHVHDRRRRCNTLKLYQIEAATH